MIASTRIEGLEEGRCRQQATQASRSPFLLDISSGHVQLTSQSA